MSLSTYLCRSACALGALGLAMPALADTNGEAEVRRGAELASGFISATARGADNDDLYGGRGFGNTRRNYSLILFEDPGLRGAGYGVSGEIRHLRHTGFNDEVSSIAVRQGSWQVCSDPDFRGNCQVVTNDTLELRRFGLNDNISSVRPVNQRDWNDRDRRDDDDWGRWGHRDDDDCSRRLDEDDDWRRWGNDDRYGRDHRSAGVILYTDPDGRGRALPVDGAIRYLQPLGFNDNISSIRVNSGRWEICSDPDYRGRCRVIDNSIGYTLHIQLNDNISSIRPAYGRGGGRRNW